MKKHRLVLSLLLVLACLSPLAAAVAVKGSVNPLHPYDPYFYGLFEDQTITAATTPRNGDTAFPIRESTWNWSLYIPDDLQPKSSVYMILIPDGMTADEFTASDTGQSWMKAADDSDDPFAVAFIEPENGGEWNIACLADGRDDVALGYAVYSAIRDKSAKVNAFLSVDKNCVYLVGYEEGATMASIVASAWPQNFASTTLIAPTSYEEDTIEKWLGSAIFPYSPDNLNGYDPEIKGGMVAMPMHVFPGSNVSAAEEIAARWAEINSGCTNPDTARDRAYEVAEVVPYNTPEAIVDMTDDCGRFMGYPGGTIKSIYRSYSNPNMDRNSGTFIPVWEDPDIDEYVRRWALYVPASYDASAPVPLVVSLHGSSASFVDHAEETRWPDVADENGFIVAFVQAYVVGDPNPFPQWFTVEGKAVTDVDYIAKVVEKICAICNIDESRMYLTGHSMGSRMSQLFALSDKGDLFAAYGPVSSLSDEAALSAYADYVADAAENTTTLPMWFFRGEFDQTGYAIDGTEPGDTVAFDFYGTTVNGIEERDPVPVVEELNSDIEKFVTTSFSIDGAPVVRYTQIKESPHVYMSEEAQLLWPWFARWSRDADGTARFDGKPISISK